MSIIRPRQIAARHERELHRTKKGRPHQGNGDIDTWATTSDFVNHEPVTAEEDLPVSLRAGVRSTRAARKAGTSPKTRPVKSETPRVKDSTRRSSRGLSPVISAPLHTLTAN